MFDKPKVISPAFQAVLDDFKEETKKEPLKAVRERVSAWIAKGAVQVSNKYRLLAMIPEGQDPLELMEKLDPRWHEAMLCKFRHEAAINYLHFREEAQMKLTYREFAEYKRQMGNSVAKEFDDLEHEASDELDQ